MAIATPDTVNNNLHILFLSFHLQHETISIASYYSPHVTEPSCNHLNTTPKSPNTPYESEEASFSDAYSYDVMSYLGIICDTIYPPLLYQKMFHNKNIYIILTNIIFPDQSTTLLSEWGNYYFLILTCPL